MHAVLFDDEESWNGFLPLTFTRPLAGLRFGILTLAEKWSFVTGKKCAYVTRPHLEIKFPCQTFEDSVYINAAVCPDDGVLAAIAALKKDEALYAGKLLLASYEGPFTQNDKRKVFYDAELLMLRRPTDLFTKNSQALKADFKMLTTGRTSRPLSDSVKVIGEPAQVFLEEGVTAEACTFNTTAGPIYLGYGSEIMEGAAIRGSFALGDHSVVKMNARIYGATTVGPHCKVGGEISNSVIFGYSNKAHDGFLGNSVLGEWCNLGADTNNSNLKNNYSNVKLYSYLQKKLVDTGLQFCGLIMGDHSKSGINTMFNTGTVVGVGANVFGSGFPPTHIPSFSWGGSEGFQPHLTEKMFDTASKVYERRGLKFNQTEKDILLGVKALENSQVVG